MLGEELRRAREAAGLTQEGLADRAGVDRTYVSLLERDKQSPSVEMLFRVCAALEIRPSTLLARVEAAGTRPRDGKRQFKRGRPPTDPEDR
jgi:transcriptional regulator with XRE-family HTH domain